jgi:hypothetical protein
VLVEPEIARPMRLDVGIKFGADSRGGVVHRQSGRTR